MKSTLSVLNKKKSRRNCVHAYLRHMFLASMPKIRSTWDYIPTRDQYSTYMGPMKFSSTFSYGIGPMHARNYVSAYVKLRAVPVILGPRMSYQTTKRACEDFGQ